MSQRVKLLLLYVLWLKNADRDLLRGSIIGTFNEPCCALLSNPDNKREFPVYFQLKYHHHNSNKVQLLHNISPPLVVCIPPSTNPTQSSHPHLVTLFQHHPKIKTTEVDAPLSDSSSCVIYIEWRERSFHFH